MFYTFPAKLAAEQAQFERDIQDFINGDLDETKFKALRVAQGVYEQRQSHTYMIRIRCASGAVLPRQLRRVAELAECYGNDEVHFTTRQELQIHDVLIQDVPTVLRELRLVGLSARGGGGNTIRNILTSEDAGINAKQPFDPDPYVMALTTRMVSEEDSWNLPRKFKLAFSTNEADTAFTQTTCLGFLATTNDGQNGFKVYCAGGMGAKPMVGHLLMDFIPVTQVYHVTRALKTMFDKYGNRRSKTTSRIKFLWKKLQREGFEKLFFEEYNKLKDDVSLTLELSPFIFANAPRERITLPQLELEEKDRAEFRQWETRYVTMQKQAGLFAIRVPLRLGDLKRSDAKQLCDFLEAIGDNTIRCGRNQNIYLRNIPEAYKVNAYYVIMGLQQTLVRFAAIFSNMINCTGASTCKLGICLPRGLSDAVRTRLAESTLPLDELSDFRLNMSGCPNTCGMHHIAHLGFFGKIMRKDGHMYPGYNILAGARVGMGTTVYAKKYGEVAAKHVPNFVHDFLQDYLAVKADYADYYAYLEARGIVYIERLCEKYRELPSFAESTDFYTDFGAKKLISLSEIGTAECSAGMFDMIGVERKRIKTLRKELAQVQAVAQLSATELAQLEALLYQLAIATARMLLVTRGLDAKGDEQVFALFAKHFITAGLLAHLHLPLIEEAQAQAARGIASLTIDREEAVLQCAAAVESLYKAMDDSLRFTKQLQLA